jgi:hypothetical protein
MFSAVFFVIQNQFFQFLLMPGNSGRLFAHKKSRCARAGFGVAVKFRTIGHCSVPDLCGLAIFLRILVACVCKSTKRLAGYLEEDNDLLARLAPESVAISLHWFVASRASRRCH